MHHRMTPCSDEEETNKKDNTHNTNEIFLRALLTDVWVQRQRFNNNNNNNKRRDNNKKGNMSTGKARTRARVARRVPGAASRSSLASKDTQKTVL